MQCVRKDGLLRSVITLERHSKDPFDAETILLAESAAAALSAALGLKLRSSDLFAGRLRDSVENFLTALFGRRRPALKVGTLLALAALIYLATAKAEFRIPGRKAVTAGRRQKLQPSFLSTAILELRPSARARPSTRATCSRL